MKNVIFYKGKYHLYCGTSPKTDSFSNRCVKRIKESGSRRCCSGCIIDKTFRIKKHLELSLSLTFNYGTFIVLAHEKEIK